MKLNISLVDLYKGKGEEELLKITPSHRMLLKYIVESNMDGCKPQSRKTPRYQNNSMNQPFIMDLISWGLIQYSPKLGLCYNESYSDSYLATDYGIAVVAFFNLKSKKNKSGHNKIIYDLQSYLSSQGNFVFDDIEVRTQYGSSRPDVFSLNKTLNVSNMNPTAYEIKHSRSDFLSDMKKPDKWKSYLEIAERLYYVCPEGLISKEEVPKECGLIYQMSRFDFKKVKSAKKGKGQLSIELMMKLLLKNDSDKNITMIKPYHNN